MDGMKLLRKHQKKQERGEILVFPRYGTGCFVKQGEAMSRIRRESPEYAFICSELRA